MKILVEMEVPDGVIRRSDRSRQYWSNQLAASLRLIAQHVQIRCSDTEIDQGEVRATLRVKWPDAAKAA